MEGPEAMREHVVRNRSSNGVRFHEPENGLEGRSEIADSPPLPSLGASSIAATLEDDAQPLRPMRRRFPEPRQRILEGETCVLEGNHAAMGKPPASEDEGGSPWLEDPQPLCGKRCAPALVFEWD